MEAGHVALSLDSGGASPAPKMEIRMSTAVTGDRKESRSQAAKKGQERSRERKKRREKHLEKYAKKQKAKASCT